LRRSRGRGRYKKTGASNWDSVTISTNSYTLTALSANTSYDWAVRTTCQVSPLTQSAYSKTVTFTTALNLDDTPIAKADNLKGNTIKLFASVYPVPVTNTNATLAIKNSNGNATVTLSDMLGKPLWRANNIADGKIDIPASKLPAGVYIINIYSGKENVVVRLIKQ